MEKSKLKDEDINKVIYLYQNTNESLIKIAQSIGYKTKDIVNKILKDNNIEKRRSVKYKISIDREEEIVTMYQNGFTEKLIGTKFGVGNGVVARVLNKHNIAKRKTFKIYEIDENYFKSIDTANKAYILGFIYADGFVRKDNLNLSVVVHTKDIDILEKIISELKTNIEIKHVNYKDINNNRTHSRIDICNKNICSDLNKLGCMNNKTFDLKFPNLEHDLISHFVRGFMDGDGCISIKDGKNKFYSLSFTGTKDMMEELKNILDVDNKITYYRNAYALSIGKKKDVLRILAWIYSNAELYLERKYSKYLEIQNDCKDAG